MSVRGDTAPPIPAGSPSTEAFQLTLAWLCASIGALIVGLAPLSAAFQNGHYMPIGPDGFYHARRILDAVADPSSFFQFDPHTEAPGAGGLVLWPWMYDYVMSLIVRVAFALGFSKDPMAILVHIPPIAFVFTVGIAVALCRALRLSITATFFALLCTALFPLSQTLYGIGNIDHHFAEHMFVLGSIASGVFWLRKPESRARAAIAGLVLGVAPGIHTAHFILQLPLLLTFAVMWFRREQRPAATLVFSISLLVATLAIAIPSLPLREGHFEYYTLSWFQVYVAACTAAFSVLLQRTNPDRPGMLRVGLAAIVMVAPILGQMALAHDFFAVSIEGMEEISEVQSPLDMLRQPDSFNFVSSLYTYLLFIAPLTALACAWKIWREREPSRTLFWIASFGGLMLLGMQLRLQYFGSFALYLPLLVLLDDWTRTRVAKLPYAWGACAIVIAISLYPAFKGRLFESQAVAGDPYYAVTRPLYGPFAAACHEHPGVVLAEPDDGHYIRFHTDCSVIANNFLVTARQAERTREERTLLELPAKEALARAPYVRYVFVRSGALFYVETDGSLRFDPNGVKGMQEHALVGELLNADVQALPEHLRLVYELKANADARPYARLFSVER